MQRILTLLSNEIVFWVSWIIIPLIMEIVPAVAGFFLLVKKRILYKKDAPLIYYPPVTLIVPVYNSADTLYACLDSIRNSDYQPEQLIITVPDRIQTGIQSVWIRSGTVIISRSSWMSYWSTTAVRTIPLKYIQPIRRSIRR